MQQFNKGQIFPEITTTTDFEQNNRFNIFLAGTGSASVTDGGLYMDTGAVGNSYAQTDWYYSFLSVGNLNLHPVIKFRINCDILGTDFQIWLTMGAVGVTFDATVEHIGFKITRVASGVINLYATQADGATETASASLTTVAAGDELELMAVVQGTGGIDANVDYYWRKNAGALSAATNLSAHMPTDAVDTLLEVAVNDGAVASQTAAYVVTMSHTR